MRTKNAMGKVVAFEGMDFAGKSTLINNVMKEVLKSKTLFIPLFNEPRKDTPEYAFLRKFIIDPKGNRAAQVHVSVATRVALYEDHIIPLLKEGHDIITDRCVLTSMVYQQDDNHDVAKILHFNVESGKHLPHRTIPDVIVYLDLTHEEYLNRLNKQTRDEIEDVETHLSKKENFDKYVKEYRKALKHIQLTTGCKVIESNDPMEIVDQLNELGMFL